MYKNIPIKVVYNYYYTNVLDANDTNLKIQINEKEEYYDFDIQYKDTKLKYNIIKPYFDCSDSILVILDSCNKKPNKVFLRYRIFERFDGKFQFIRLPLNKTYMYAPNHDILFYFNKMPKYDEKSNWIEMSYLKFYDKFIFKFVDRHNYKYSNKRFGEDELKNRYWIQDFWQNSVVMYQIWDSGSVSDLELMM